jgi:hypothetical protein
LNPFGDPHPTIGGRWGNRWIRLTMMRRGALSASGELNPRQEAHLMELCETGEHSTAERADSAAVAASRG